MLIFLEADFIQKQWYEMAHSTSVANNFVPANEILPCNPSCLSWHDSLSLATTVFHAFSHGTCLRTHCTKMISELLLANKSFLTIRLKCVPSSWVRLTYWNILFCPQGLFHSLNLGSVNADCCLWETASVRPNRQQWLWHRDCGIF